MRSMMTDKNAHKAYAITKPIRIGIRKRGEIKINMSGLFIVK